MKRVLLLRSNPVLPDPPVEKMANCLMKQGYEVIILGWDRSSSYEEKEDVLELLNGVARIIRFGIKASFGSGFKGNFFALCKFQLRILNWIKKNVKNIDVIHAFDFDTAFISWMYSRKKDIHFIYHILDFYVHCHDLKYKFLECFVKNKELQIINEAYATIICTEKRKEQIQGSNPQNLYVIHNTPNDVQNVKSDSIIMSISDRTKIVYVGILTESRLLREIIHVVESSNEYELHIGGFGQLENYIIEKSKENSNIYYYGKLQYSETISLERDCDLMVAIYDPKVPNHKYSAPNKFYESLMLGKPIIMAKNTGFDDVIADNSIGLTIEYSESSLRNGLEQLVSRKQEWKEMGNRARKLYEESYSWEIMEYRIVELYSNLK